MKPIALTVGMGIGPEIAVKALGELSSPTLLLAKKGTLTEAVEQLGLDWTNLWNNRAVQIVEFEDGEEPAEVQAIRTAVEFCQRGQCSAMVTGPINKAVLMERGFSFPGHTDFLGHLCGVERPVMAFSGGALQVVLVTTHMPLSQVPAALRTEDIVRVVDIAHAAWLSRGQRARFAICGLNPHAGEQGKLGTEDLDIIQPACVRLRAQGIDVTDVVSSETAFLLARDGKVDVVVAMYHDQGLTPLKLVDFGSSVNWTLGLPIVRTSVDHGTADTIVGQGVAKPDSLIAAWNLAKKLVENRTN